MHFEFATANRVLFGPGTMREVAPQAAGFGSRVLVVCGRSMDRAESLIEQLMSLRMTVSTFNVSGEPTIEAVLSGTKLAREDACDVVIGFGGGSVIDAGKAVAALVTNQGNLFDFLEVVGKGRPLDQAPAPFIAVPTTAGTGAEVTRNAVLTSPDHRVKVSLRSPLMLPRLAVVDPELTLALPPYLTAGTGLDALTQLVEPYVCNSPSPITDALCREGMRRVVRALRRACFEGSNLQARQDMALASLFGGVALANARLGAVHGLAGPLGGMFPAPHGMICARLLPLVIQTNINALQDRAPDSPAIKRLNEVARILTGFPNATVGDGVTWLQELCSELGVSPLSRFGVSEKDVPQVVLQAQRASSMKGNPISLNDGELADILQRAL